MSDVSSFGVVIIVALTAVLLGLVLGRRWMTESRNLRLLKDRIGLEQVQGDFHFVVHEGRYRERILRFETSRRAGIVYTRLRMAVNNLARLSLLINEDGFFRNGESFGAQVFKSGDEAFDRRFIVKSHTPDFAARFLSLTALRHKLLQAKFFEVELLDQDAVATFYDSPVAIDPEELWLLLDILNDVARQIELYQSQDTLTNPVQSTPCPASAK